MLSPALLRLCCLAVMAPALTKAVRQADGFTFMLMSHKNGELLPSRIELPIVADRTSPADDARRTANGCGLHNGALVTNGELWHPGPYNGDRLRKNNSIAVQNELKYVPLPEKTPNNVNGHCSLHTVGGGLTFKPCNLTMNDSTPKDKESMGLLNANTSLDSEFHGKNYHGQLSSPVCLELSSHGSEPLDMLEQCQSNPPLSLPGSPKSSGESTSTVTAHNPPVVTFAELAEVKSDYEKCSMRAKDLLLRLRRLQILQIEKHISNQLSVLFDHYQKKFSIPCQQQMKHNIIRRMKDPVDLKAEFLQNEDVRNLSTAALVNLVRKIECSSNSSSNPTNRSLLPYTENVDDKNSSVICATDCNQIRQVTGCLMMRVKHLENVMDSDATESSSGGESCDEYDGYDDKKTNTTSLHRRALWTWVHDRAPIAKRWTWLQSQVHDLEYRVRQISDLLTQARSAKGKAIFEEAVTENQSLIADRSVSLKKSLKAVNGFVDHSSVTSNSNIQPLENVPPELCLESIEKNIHNCGSDDGSSAIRTRPFKGGTFRKRKLLYTSGLHHVSRKAARLSTVRCNCNNRVDAMPCIVCCGRYNNTQSVDPDVMPLPERVALLKPSYHPVLSFEKDILLSLHFEKHLRTNETYYRVPKQGTPPLKKPQFGMKPRGMLDHARHHSRRLTKNAAQTLLSSAKYRNNRNISSKLRNRGLAFARWKGSFKKKRFRRWSAVSSCSSRQESPVHSPAVLDDGREGFDMRRRRDGHQYDIDNIVIPYNMKTATSFQKPQYKEIVTPKWRYLDEDMENELLNEDFEPPEDISEEAVSKRHEKSEIAERKIVRGGGSSNLNSARRVRRNFRQDSRADSSGANTPDHITMFQQDIMFQDSNSFISGGPASPALSPPATPGSVHTLSDDSQPSGSNTTTVQSTERKRTTSLTKRDKSVDEGMFPVQDDVDYPPFETRIFPLSDEVYEMMLQESALAESIRDREDKEREEEEETSLKDPSSPGSPDTSSSTSSAFEDEDDTADPEWTVVRRQNGPDRTLVIKLAKR